MSYYSTPPSSYKPQVRVEGFHLPSPETPPPHSQHPQHNPNSSSLSQHPQHPHPDHNGHNHHSHARHPSNASTSIVDDLFPLPPPSSNHQGHPGLSSSNPGYTSGGDPLFPSSLGTRRYSTSTDFEDDLASLGALNGHGGGHHQQGSSSSYHEGNGLSGANSISHDGGMNGGNGGYGNRPHNIFDVSSPIPMPNMPSSHTSSHMPSHLSTSHQSSHLSTLPGSQPSSLSHTAVGSLPHTQGTMQGGQGMGSGHSPGEGYHGVPVPSHFNSTLPALNSSMRYENPGEASNANGPLTPSSPHPPPPPSTFALLQRHTPSPTITQPGGPAAGRQRSRSRPPSQTGLGGVGLPGSINGAQLNGSVGPARTTRQRRGSSISGTSPPPLGGRPHAIVIPGRSSNSTSNGGPLSAGGSQQAQNPQGGPNGWNGFAGNEYSLPTPDSMTSHSYGVHGHGGQGGHGFGPFSLGSPNGSGPSNGTQGVVTKGSGIIDHGYLDGPHAGPGNGYASGAWPGNPPPPQSNGGMFGMGGHQHHNSLGGMPLATSPLTTTGALSSNLNGPPTGSSSASLSSTTPTGGPPAGAAPPADKQNLLAHEKRRRRRESHNAVERRRRDNINEKISELATLIPECMLEGGVGPPNAKDNGRSVTPPITEDALVPHGVVPPPSSQAGGSSSSPTNSTSGMLELKKEKDDGEGILNSGAGGGQGGNGVDNAGVVKANKGMILRKSVEYIRYLQQLVTVQGQRNRELEGELRKYRGDAPLPSSSSGDALSNPIDVNLESFGTLDDDHDMSVSGDMDSFDVNMGSMNGMGMHDDAAGKMGGQPQGDGTRVKRRGSNASHKRKSSAGGRLPSMPEEEEPTQHQHSLSIHGQGAMGGGKDVDMDGDQGMSPHSASSEGDERGLGSEEGGAGSGVVRGRTETRVGNGGW